MRLTDNHATDTAPRWSPDGRRIAYISDQKGQPKIFIIERQGNLLNYLLHFEGKPRYLIVGEAPGPWGCRFSGVPFTSERQLAQGELPFAGEPTSIHNPPVAER